MVSYDPADAMHLVFALLLCPADVLLDERFLWPVGQRLLVVNLQLLRDVVIEVPFSLECSRHPSAVRRLTEIY
jgi:hypothetical protein